MIMKHRHPIMLSLMIIGVLVILQMVYCMFFPDISYAAGNTTYYVSTTGNDNNAGTFDSPWKTIQKACNSVAAGDTVCIKAGTYVGKITVPTSGTSSAYITIQNYNNDAVIIDGSSGSGDGVINISNKSYVRIKGLEVCNNSRGDPPVGIYVSGYGSGVEILNNKVHNIVSSQDAHGIAVYATSGTQSINGLVIDGNEVYNCQLGSSESVVVNGNVDGFRITNNRVHDNNNIGIDCIGFEGTASSNDQARNGVVSGNTVYNITSRGNPAYGNDTCADGLYVDGGSHITMERNRVYNCDIGIEVASEHLNKVSDYITVRNNIVSGCGLYGLCFGGAESGNGYAQNCTFVNNTCYNNATTVEIQKAQNNVLANNIFYGGTLREGTVGTNAFKYNIWYGNSRPSGLSATDKYTDPRFVSSSDYHLQAVSPAIDAGDPALTADTVGALDFDGYARITGSAVDCGAYEYDSGIIPTPTPTPTPTPSTFPAPAPIGAAAVSYNNIRISWGAVNSASKYQLYRATSGTGTYTLIATTTYTAYTNSNVTLGTLYYYKVRAYRLVGSTRIFSPYSAVVSVRTVLGAPSPVSVVQLSSRTVRITWGAVSGSMRYEVWRSASGSGLYTRVAATSYTYYLDTNFRAGTMYYYKVRAYRSVSGSIVYSDYSVISMIQTTS